MERDSSGPAVGGIFREIIDPLIAEGSACAPGAKLGNVHQLGFRDHVMFDLEACKRRHDVLVQEAGVDLLLFTQVIAPRVTGRGVDGLYLFSKDGLSYVEAKVVVDCTGDADVAHRAGFETVMGRGGLMSPTTLISFVEDVDRAPLAAYLEAGGDRRFRQLVRDLRDKGVWTYPEETIIVVPTLREDVFLINTRRQVGVDGTSARSMTEAAIEGRQQAQEFLERVLHPYYPGFAAARLRSTVSPISFAEVRRRPLATSIIKGGRDS